MSQAIVIHAEPRRPGGSLAARRLRREGGIPAVVYSEGRPGETVQVDAHDVAQLLRRHRGEHMLVDLEIGGANRKVLLKDVQHHPVDGHVIHIDFYEVSMTRRIRVEVPLRLVGDPIGVTQQGGILDHLLRAVEIECLPSDIPEELAIDVSGLAVGRHLSVADISIDAARYRVVTAPDIAVAAVSLPKTEEVAEAAAAEGAAEPEVLTARKSEEGEEEPGKAAAKEKEGGAKDAASAKEAAPKAGKEKAGKG